MALIIHPNWEHETVNGPPKALEALPDSLWEIVFGRLDSARDLASCECVCKRARRIATSEVLWRSLCQAMGYMPATTPPCWKSLYRYQREILQALLLQQSTTAMTNMHGDAMWPTLNFNLPIHV